MDDPDDALAEFLSTGTGFNNARLLADIRFFSKPVTTDFESLSSPDGGSGGNLEF